jgi:dTDP-4-dehydrorhamnose reductase
MRILIAGANGRLGSQLLEALNKQHACVGIDADVLDITDFHAVQNRVKDMRPDLIINSAAWTQVDECALHPEKAILINGYGAQNLSVAAYAVGAAILHVSSNEVFDGKGQRPYYEYDPVNPVNPYGYSKLVGERTVIETNPRHYIVRTSWLFAHGGHNFVHAILNAARAGKTLRVVIDEVANPTYNLDLVHAIEQLLATGRYGTYHLCNAGSVSRYQFARYVLDQAGFATTPIEPITRYQWQRPSQPPAYTGLANTAARAIGIELRDWREAVTAFLAAENLLAGPQAGQ